MRQNNIKMSHETDLLDSYVIDVKRIKVLLNCFVVELYRIRYKIKIYLNKQITAFHPSINDPCCNFCFSNLSRKNIKLIISIQEVSYLCT